MLTVAVEFKKTMQAGKKSWLDCLLDCNVSLQKKKKVSWVAEPETESPLLFFNESIVFALGCIHSTYWLVHSLFKFNSYLDFDAKPKKVFTQDVVVSNNIVSVLKSSSIQP